MESKSTKIFNIIYWLCCLLNIGILIGSLLFPLFRPAPSYLVELADKGYKVIAHLEQYITYIHLNRFIIYLCLLIQIVSILKLKRAGAAIKAKRNTTIIIAAFLAVSVALYWGAVLVLFNQIEWR